MLSVGSPGSLVGVRLAGVGPAEDSPAGVADGDESGVCGKACNPGVETGDAAGVAGGDESGVCGKASIPAPGVETGNAAGVGTGVEMGDAAGTCPPSGNAEIAARNPTAIKILPTGTNLLISILVQLLWICATCRRTARTTLGDRIGRLLRC